MLLWCKHHFDGGNTAHLPNHVENEAVRVKYVTGAAHRAEGSGDEGEEGALQGEEESFSKKNWKSIATNSSRGELTCLILEQGFRSLSEEVIAPELGCMKNEISARRVVGDELCIRSSRQSRVVVRPRRQVEINYSESTVEFGVIACGGHGGGRGGC